MTSQTTKTLQLSIREPFATLIVTGIKKIENRSFSFKESHKNKLIAIQTSTNLSPNMNESIVKVLKNNKQQWIEKFPNRTDPILMRLLLTKKKRLGKIIGFASFQNCEKPETKDKIWTNFPKNCKT